jgi:hypothetical protein
MSDIYKIKPANLESLYEQIEKLNRRAIKLGCEPAVVEIIGSEIVKASKVMPGGRILKYEYEVKLVTVTGETPKLEGWSLIAKVEYVEAERMICCVPGEECPEEFRFRGVECDHCKSDRNRKNVFVLRHEDGRHVQVGRTCIQDFLGGVSPEQLLSRATWNFSIVEMCGEFDEGRECCGRYIPESIDIVEYLNAVAICIRRIGWLSRSACRFGDESSTSSDAWYLCKPPMDDRNFKEWQKWVEKTNLHHQERDEKLAADALEWAVNQPVKGVVDYLYNLGVACRAGYVTRKTCAIVASAISSYMRHLDREAEMAQKREADKDKSREWVGEVNVRQDFTNLTVTGLNSFEGRYGVTTLISFEDEPGNIIKWFASESVNLDDVYRGDVVTLKGTVKKHDVYKEVKQTVIFRCRISTINGEKV